VNKPIQGPNLGGHFPNPGRSFVQIPKGANPNMVSVTAHLLQGCRKCVFPSSVKDNMGTLFGQEYRYPPADAG
jgi:hypothetical protein